jgi:hypothetical protein
VKVALVGQDDKRLAEQPSVNLVQDISWLGGPKSVNAVVCGARGALPGQRARSRGVDKVDNVVC